MTLTAIIQVGGQADDKVPYLQSVDLASDLSRLPGLTVNFSKFDQASHVDPISFTQENIREILRKLG